MSQEIKPFPRSNTRPKLSAASLLDHVKLTKSSTCQNNIYTLSLPLLAIRHADCITYGCAKTSTVIAQLSNCLKVKCKCICRDHPVWAQGSSATLMAQRIYVFYMYLLPSCMFHHLWMQEKLWSDRTANQLSYIHTGSPLRADPPFPKEAPEAKRQVLGTGVKVALAGNCTSFTHADPPLFGPPAQR